MKPSRFTEEQIIGILREQEAGAKTADVCLSTGLAATFYKWKTKYGGLEVSDAGRPKALEDENAKLKKAAGGGDARQRHAQRCPIKKMVTPAASREAVVHLQSSFRPRRRRLPPDLGERQVISVAPNVLDRTLQAPAANRKWIADFT